MKKTKKSVKFAAILLSIVFMLSLACVSVSAEEEVEYEEKTISFDFNGDAGMTLEDSELADMFIMQIIRGAGGDGQITDDGFVSLFKYAGFYTDIDVAYDYFAGAYTFSVDYYFDSNNPSLGGIFVRLTDPAGYRITNPKNAGTQQSFDLFEWDWYGENGGSEKGVSSIGGSGIRVYQNRPASSIGVTVKTRVEDGLYVHSQGVEFAYPEGFNADGMNTYKFDDNGKGLLKIYVNDALLATVEYDGEPGTYPDGDEGDSDILYYKHAVIKDAEGTQKLELDNARISAEYSAVGIGNRGDTTTHFDNIRLTYMQKKKTATEAPTEAPATPTTAPTEKATDNSSNATAVSGDATPGGSEATKKPDDNQKKSGNNTWIYILCGVVGVAAVAVILVSVLKGKKKK
ncbi:MAG: hypothetical protein J5950_01110 [Clostridia bacterium]|nr:hypothetical protein [Clostridia bacterium]